MKLFYQLSLLFFLFSFLGWVMEVVLVSIEYRRLVNRGFLLGPWCPIYGCGVTFVTIVVGGLLGYRGTWGDVFVAGFFLCGGLEYFTSWYLEKLFHARWWDYSKKPSRPGVDRKPDSLRSGLCHYRPGSGPLLFLLGVPHPPLCDGHFGLDSVGTVCL